MHHVVVERWSRRSGPLHARDARAKLGVLLAFLVAISTTAVGAWAALAAYGVLLLCAAVASKLPLRSLLIRVLAVLPFSTSFALLTWWSGDADRAWMLAAKAFLSVSASLLLIATTPMTQLAEALERLHVPRTLVLVIQFLYRYLFVISEQGQHMRLAAAARGGSGARGFQSAAGAVGVLFVRSWERADGVYSAMLARGFQGTMPALSPAHFHRADFAFLYLAATACAVVRLAL